MELIETTLVSIIIILTFCPSRIQRRERITTVFWFSCVVSTVFRHVRSTQKEQYQQPQVVAEPGVLLRRKEEDLVVYRVPSEWVLLENSNNTNGE